MFSEASVLLSQLVIIISLQFPPGETETTEHQSPTLSIDAAAKESLIDVVYSLTSSKCSADTQKTVAL